LVDLYSSLKVSIGRNEERIQDEMNAPITETVVNGSYSDRVGILTLLHH
jgi:hypothetical protein